MHIKEDVVQTIRLNQEALNEHAMERAHQFQKVTLEKMMKLGWQVNAVKSYGETHVVTVYHQGGAFGMITPNGLFQRPAKGKSKVEWSWKHMVDLAEATIPAFHAQ
jgi:hypothetical protein